MKPVPRVHHRHAIPVVVMGLVTLLGAGCSSDEPEDSPMAIYLRETWGIRIAGFEDWDGTQFVIAADGVAEAQGIGIIDVAGFGTEEIIVEEEVYPQAQGGDTTVLVALADGSDERYFRYNPVENYILIGNEDQGVAIDNNEDGTYTLWTYVGDEEEQPHSVGSGFEALLLADEFAGLSEISPHVLLMAFAMAHSPTYEARIQVFCSGGLDQSSQPVVCEIFEEFCECAACLVLGRQGVCDECPEL